MQTTVTLMALGPCNTGVYLRLVDLPFSSIAQCGGLIICCLAAVLPPVLQATSGEYLRIWRIADGDQSGAGKGVHLERLLNNVSDLLTFCSAFDILVGHSQDRG
jgi:hypothetical protein